MVVILIIVIIVLLVKNRNRKREINDINEHLYWQDWKQHSKIGNLDIYLYEYDDKKECINCYFNILQNTQHTKGTLKVYCPKQEYMELGELKSKKAFYVKLDALTQKYKNTISYKK